MQCLTKKDSPSIMPLMDDAATTPSKFVIRSNQGTQEPLVLDRLLESLHWASQCSDGAVDVKMVFNTAMTYLFDGISSEEIIDTLILATTTFIECDPAYAQVAAKLLHKKLFKLVTDHSVMSHQYDSLYRDSFVEGIKKGVECNLLDKKMLDFDLHFLKHLALERDALFDFMGFKTLYERYFLCHEQTRLELPQAFWMRVAMGLAYHEPDKNRTALDFYSIMSTFKYVPSTPTLLHSGLVRPQLSSCYLTTVEDDLVHIFKSFGDNAQLSKWSGGVANDWSNIRAIGGMVNSIRTESQGLIPFLKIVNDTTAAINRSGKRRSATVVYLESWHYEIEDFLDLRRNTGDERRRTHDINTAIWVPDLFMKRMLADKQWTLFSPHETHDLHGTYGKKFEQLYTQYEAKAAQGQLKIFKVISAKQLWKRMLSRLFETGHPWITFKDPCNIRSPQDHVGVVNSSNLCTEITLNTSPQETAVCNLGSINLGEHINEGGLDTTSLARTVKIAIRMLDNVIDINFYPTKEAEYSNKLHRPIGLGLMGFQDALYKLGRNFEDSNIIDFSDQTMEYIAYHAILTSSELARQRGTYNTYQGSKWDRNIFPQDTLDLLEDERGEAVLTPRNGILDWSLVRAHVKQYGMRNSNTMAIAPTATISNIVGCFPCIEPIYKNIYVKANMTGEFTIVNKYLVADLKKLDLWNGNMLEQLKYYDGSVQHIKEIPQTLKNKYKEAFELDPIRLLKNTAARGKWIDQSQSHNIFMAGTSGKMLHDIYVTAWQLGIKTTYYLRCLGATQIEKSTLDAAKFGYTQKRVYEDQQQSTSDDHALQRSYENDTTSLAQGSEIQDSTTAFNSLKTTCAVIQGTDCEVCQ
jgi:ribonucleoside-diphosphate reductase alpha chain